MIKATVKDKDGNEIYITEERWKHITTGHREMQNNFVLSAYIKHRK
ncbi:MAG: hypothetical protein ACE5I1_04550 [bacterium]